MLGPRRYRVRNLDQFHTYQLLSSSSRTPLITLWTASWCPSCKHVAPLIQELIESGVGEAEGGVGYCTVEYDSPDVMDAGLGLTYMINSVPTLLSFDAQEAQTQTKVTDGKLLANRKFLEDWYVLLFVLAFLRRSRALFTKAVSLFLACLVLSCEI